jgi:hypothetical protein
MGRLEVFERVVASEHEWDYVVCGVGSWLSA